MTEELWEEIPEFENYLVSNHGRVYKKSEGSYLRGSMTKNGTRSLQIKYGGVKKSFSIPTMVARLFHPYFQEGVKVDFIDGDKENAHIENIELIDWTLKEPRETNVKHYTWARRAMVVEWDKEYDTVRELADDIGGTLTSVYKCLRGEQKTHLGLTFEYVD